jgi:hypothetical protein
MDGIMHDGMDVDMDMEQQQRGHERADLELPVSTYPRLSSPSSPPPFPLALL